MLRLGQDDRIKKYGPPRSERARAAVVRRVLINPATLTQIPFWVHAKIADRVVHAFTEASLIWDEWPSEIQGYNIRTIAGSKAWSLHSWALAWDVFDDDGRNRDPKTGRSTMSPNWFKSAAKHGELVWGGDFRTPDPHHIEFPY